jgi:hypothetical protein
MTSCNAPSHHLPVVARRLVSLRIPALVAGDDADSSRLMDASKSVHTVRSSSRVASV